MDDERIRQLTADVLNQLRGPSEAGASPDLEARVAALEAAVARLQAAPRAAAASAATAAEVHVLAHPALRVLNVPGGSDRCLLEPDQPCVQSHACRTLGH
jgi:hypothetical protein